MRTPRSPGQRPPAGDRRASPEPTGRAVPKPRSSSRPLRAKPGSKPSRVPQAPVAAAPGTGEPLRIAKAMARAGLCSRREAERWIEDGRVSVNGKVLRTPAFEVSARDRVLVDGQPLPASEPTRLWRFY